jgi:hypothetical protein
MRVAILILATVLFALSGSPLLAQREYPATATIRGENIWLRADAAEDTEVLAYLQRGDQVRITAEAVPADGDAFYPIRLVETGETGWVRDLAIDPRSRAARGGLPEVVIDDPPSEEMPTGVSFDEAAYADEVGSQLTVLVASSEAFTRLMLNPQLGDTDWLIQVAAVIALWQVTQEEAERITPPDAFAEAHDAYLRSLDYLNKAGRDIARGIDTGNVDLLTRATTNIELASAEMATTTQLLNELAEERGLR